MTQKKIFPRGCEFGYCMPCGGNQGIDYETNFLARERFHKIYFCIEHKKNGCPEPRPQPIHSFNNDGTCHTCGYEPRYITDDGILFSSLTKAIASGYKRHQLTNEDDVKLRNSVSLEDLVIIQDEGFIMPSFIYADGWIDLEAFEEKAREFEPHKLSIFHGSLKKVDNNGTSFDYAFGFAVDGGKAVTLQQVLNSMCCCPF